MSAEFEVAGADQFLKLSKALKAAGRLELRKELNKELKAAVKPILPQAEAELKKSLPSGLAKRKVRQTVRVRTGNDPGITVAIPYENKTPKTRLSAATVQRINRSGTFRHPMFPDKSKPRKEWRWFEQDAKSGGQGWFDRTYTAQAPAIRKGLEHAIETIADTIIKGAT